jgi:hypothetical protein
VIPRLCGSVVGGPTTSVGEARVSNQDNIESSRSGGLLERWQSGEDYIAGSYQTTERSLQGRPEGVRHAADEWARCSGWFPALSPDGLPAYKFGRFTWTSGNTQVGMTVNGDGKRSAVHFYIGARRPSKNFLYIPSRKDYHRAVEHFADGVARELDYEQRRMDVRQSYLWQRRRTRLAAASHVRAVTGWLALTLPLPLTALVWLTTGNWLYGVSTGWWLISLVSANVVFQMRAMGLRAIPQLLLLILYFGLGSLIFLVASITAGPHLAR